MKNLKNTQPTLNFKLDNHIYSASDINSILKSLDINNIRNKNKQLAYYNIPFSFDIETTSFYDGNEKRGVMYAFVLGINGKCIIGRTWEEFKFLLDKISKFLALDEKLRIIIYVHNLQFEFQFIRKWFKWIKIFATDTHEPLSAVTDGGIEFRCSYRLSGYNLAKVGEHLHTYKVNKMVGDLDYSIPRHSLTPLNDKELGYILNDGLVVMAYIQEEIEEHDYNIAKIELTKTGKVRTLCKRTCLYGGYRSHKNHEAQKSYQAYRSVIKPLTLTSVEYAQLKRAFQGGFTHANSHYVNKVVPNVSSYDFSSAYPSVMVLNKFPMSAPKKVKINNDEELSKYLNCYCCMFDVYFMNIKSVAKYEHYIASSKCFRIKKAIYDNGRIVKAEEIGLTITEQDFFIIRELYDYEEMKIMNFRIFKRGYLPKQFIYTILNLYEKKTTLKGVIGKEIEYMNSKENLNSLYGMCVTDINHTEILYENDEWKKTETNEESLEKNLEKYNSDRFRYLYYAWGVWVTAYNRRNLFKAICELKDDYIYSDTDSVKFINHEKHKDWFISYNKDIFKKIKYVSDLFKINPNKFYPKTIQGKVKMIGVFDYEGDYRKFKTLGAKRYLVKEQDGTIQITTSGLSKNTTINYLWEHFKTETKIFANFSEGLYIPRGYTGKLIHSYIENETNGILIDYNNVGYEYHELSSVHLEPSDYTLDFAKEFLKYLMNIKDYEE